MTDEVKNAQAGELNPTPAPSEAVAEVKAKEETIGEALKSQKQEPKEESVPLASFLEIKKENKNLAREMKELKKSIEQGATKKEVTADLKALSEKHNIDTEFLQEFVQVVRQEAEQDVEEKVSSKLKPFEEKEKAEKIDKAFNQHFSKAMEQMPEFEKIVNKDVIKTLSLNPANSNKTFTQLIEEAYGHLVTGKRTFDSASTRAGKNDSLEVDDDRMHKDPEYFDTVMKNPLTREKYNKRMIDRISSHL